MMRSASSFPRTRESSALSSFPWKRESTALSSFPRTRESSADSLNARQLVLTTRRGDARKWRAMMKFLDSRFRGNDDSTLRE